MAELSLAEIARFGSVRNRIEVGPESPKETYLEIQDALSRQGFAFGKNESGNGPGETKSWLFFRSRALNDWTQETWDNFTRIEENCLEKNLPFPDVIKDAYKICIDINPEKISGLIDILGEQFGDISYLGKIIKPKSFTSKDFPKMVLYIKGSDINEALDFSINLAKATKYQLGGSDAHLISAKEIENGSGVFLTQGDFSVKQAAKDEGKFDDYFGQDGALFKETDSRYPVYLIRRQNQIGIEEGLYKYVGMESLSKRLEALQNDAFDRIPETDNWEWQKGIREIDVMVGNEDNAYFAPRGEDLAKLINSLDKRAAELVEDPRFSKDYNFAVRAVSSLYMLSILTHPLNNGNGQSCTNMISSLLFEGGHRRCYFRAFLDGRELRARAFRDIQTSEMPTQDVNYKTIPLDQRKIREAKILSKQEYSRDFLRSSTESLWPLVKSYVTDGTNPDFGDKVKNLSHIDRAVIRSLMSRVREINIYCQQVLAEDPTGSRVLSFEEQQKAVEEAEKLIVLAKSV